MGNTFKIAITVPKDMLRQVERARKESGETRSAFIQRAIRTFLEKRREREVIRRYVEGYQKHPETEGEVEAARRAAQAILSEEPWE